MTDLKVLLREMLFGVDYGKCRLAYDLYLNQLGLQLSQMESVFAEHGVTKAQVTEMFTEHNILGFLPFIHFTALYDCGTVSKRELVAILFYMCEVSKQPIGLVHQIFAHMDATLTADMVTEAAELKLEEYKPFIEEHGILPVLITQYKQVTSTGGNIYASMVDVILAINEPEPELVDE